MSLTYAAILNLFSTILTSTSNFNDCLVIVSNKNLSISVGTDFDLFTLSQMSYNLTYYLFQDVGYFQDISPSDRCLNYLIYHTKPLESFAKLEGFMSNDSLSRYNNRKYLIMVDNDTCISAIFSESYIRTIPNFVLAYINTSDGFVKFYHQARMGFDTSVMDTWRWQDGVWITQNGGADNELYPEKIANGANGTEFRVASGYMVPYTDPYDKSGLYWGFIDSYLRKFNLTLVMYQDRTQIPDMLNLLSNRSVDIGFSMMMIIIERYATSDFVTPPVTTTIGVLAPKPLLARGWFTYTNVFSWLLWLLIVLTLTIFSLIFYLINKLGRETTIIRIDALKVLGFMINQPIDMNVGRHFVCMHMRLIFVMMALAALLFTTIYCTKLSSNIILPLYDRKIDTLEDLVESNLLFLTEDPYIPKPIGADPKRINRQLAKRIIYATEEELNKSYAPSRKHAYFAFKFSKVFNINRFQNESVLETHRLMTENLYAGPTTPYLIKNSPYLETANELMLRCVQHGLVDYWTTSTLLKDTHMTFPLNIETVESMATPATPLRVDRIAGSLMIYAIGAVISLIAFALERFVTR